MLRGDGVELPVETVLEGPEPEEEMPDGVEEGGLPGSWLGPPAHWLLEQSC